MPPSGLFAGTAFRIRCSPPLANRSCYLDCWVAFDVRVPVLPVRDCDCRTRACIDQGSIFRDEVVHRENPVLIDSNFIKSVVFSSFSYNIFLSRRSNICAKHFTRINMIH